jgi:hypothetical protein
VGLDRALTHWESAAPDPSEKDMTTAGAAMNMGMGARRFVPAPGESIQARAELRLDARLVTAFWRLNLRCAFIPFSLVAHILAWIF